MTGYDLKQELDQSTTHFWHAHHSQIYTTLHKLEDDGFIVSNRATDDNDSLLDKKVYTITDKGILAFATWLDQPITKAQKHKHGLLVRLFFSAQRDKTAILSELYTQRQHHQRRLEAYQHIPTEDWETPPGSRSKTASDMFFWRATLEHGMRYEEMYLAWLDDLIAKLESEP